MPSPFSYQDSFFSFLHDEPVFHLEEGRVDETATSAAHACSESSLAPFSFAKRPPSVALSSERISGFRSQLIQGRRRDVGRNKTENYLQDMQNSLSELESVLHGPTPSTPSTSSKFSNACGNTGPSILTALVSGSDDALADICTFRPLSETFTEFVEPPAPPDHPKVFGVGEAYKEEQMRVLQDFILDSIDLGCPYIKV